MLPCTTDIHLAQKLQAPGARVTSLERAEMMARLLCHAGLKGLEPYTLQGLITHRVV